jgi:hypothetical protein
MTYDEWKEERAGVFKYIAEEVSAEEVSELKVMESAAGFYIGTEYFDEEMQNWFPNERATPYMLTRGEAESMLEYWTKGSERIQYKN